MLLSIDFNSVVNKFNNLYLTAGGKSKADEDFLSSRCSKSGSGWEKKQIPKSQELWTLI